MRLGWSSAWPRDNTESNVIWCVYTAWWIPPCLLMSYLMYINMLRLRDVGLEGMESIHVRDCVFVCNIFNKWVSLPSIEWFTLKSGIHQRKQLCNCSPGSFDTFTVPPKNTCVTGLNVHYFRCRFLVNTNPQHTLMCNNFIMQYLSYLASDVITLVISLWIVLC